MFGEDSMRDPGCSICNLLPYGECDFHKDWIVSIYGRGNSLIGEWEIENRSEKEATDEAISDIEIAFSDCIDWTLTERNKFYEKNKKFIRGQSNLLMRKNSMIPPVDIYDNGGISSDRYTVFFPSDDTSALGIGHTGNVSNGFCMWIEAKNPRIWGE